MKRYGTWLILIAFVVQSTLESAAIGLKPAGGRSAAMAQASVALFDPWAIINNQAGTVSCTTLVFGIYAENRFLLNELSYQAGFILIPAKPGVAGLSFTRFGHNAYNENRAGLSFARSFGQHFHAGLQLDYSYVFFKEKSYRRSQLSFEAGIITRITRDLFLAVHVVDPVTWMAGENGGFVTENALIQMGLGYHLSDKIILAVQAEKDPVADIQFMAGFEYELSPSITFRSGVMAHPVQVTFGTGIHWNRVYMDLSAAMHQQLGWYPQVSIHYVSR